MQIEINSEDGPTTSHTAEANDQRSYVEEGKKIAMDSLNDAKKIYGDTIEQVTDLVRKHPLEAMAIGFGVGCLAGLVLARRQS